MKFLLSIACMSMLLLSSCHHLPQGEMLKPAKSLVETYPDSALTLLKQCLFPEKLPRAERAEYALLWAQASHEAGKPFGQDTLLEDAIRYFAEQHDTTKLFDSYEMAGIQQKWKENHRKALDYYLLAERLAASMPDSLKLGIYRKIMQQALEAHLFETSRQYARKLLQFDVKWQIFAYYHIFISYSWENKSETDSGFYYMQKSIALAEANPDCFLADYLRNSTTDTRLSSKESIRRLQKSMQLSDESSNVLTSMAYVYLQEQRLDSATYYLNRAEQNYAQEWSNNGKEYVSLRNEIGQLRACLNYALGKKNFATPIVAFNDSIYFSGERSRKALEEQSELYNRIALRNLYYKEQEQRIQLGTVSAIFIAILTIIAVTLYFRYKQNCLLEAEERAEALQKLLKDASTNEKDNHFFKKILLQQLGIIRLIATAPTEHNKELLQQMTQITHKEVPTDNLLIWDDLYPIIDNAYEGFHSKLITRYGTILNEKETQLCCLLCAGFSTKEISVVTQQSPRTVYQRKTDIRRKLEMEEKEDIATFLQRI